ncbi:MAG: HAD-IB family phosphatase [candidate division Zixibacteria bacterium]|nr:HAD-IB family phosphatase [candidate division Zixibacteria bacterium]
MLSPDKVAVAVDFDGTVTKIDIGNRLFDHFSSGRSGEVVAEWKKGLISSKECFERECALISANEPEIREYVLKQEIQPDFIGLYSFLNRNGIYAVILSDGMDYYIRLILEKYDLEIPFYSNRVKINNSSCVPEFPFYGHTCGRCANCKGYHIRELKKRYDHVIFAGDGLSDRCAVEDSDVVFAKGDLLEYCRTNNHRCFEFNSFDQVKDHISKLVDLDGSL